jgi:hypothetical protein
MITKLLVFNAQIFDRVNLYWKSKKNHQIVGSTLVIAFLLTTLFSLLYYFDLLPERFSSWVDTNKYFAIEVAFTLLLLEEIISLVFALAKSVSTSLLKQFEIFSLILLRSAFKQFGSLENPFHWENSLQTIGAMLSDSFGALIIFAIILTISKIQKHTPITSDPVDQTRFILFKKNTAIILFFLFLGSGIYDISLYLTHGQVFNFFTNFYTILIFSDILLVLISLRYNYSFLVVFRNSAFAVGTLIIRMALSSPPYYNAILGIVGGLFALGTVFLYNKYVTFSLLDKK